MVASVGICANSTVCLHGCVLRGASLAGFTIVSGEWLCQVCGATRSCCASDKCYRCGKPQGVCKRGMFPTGGSLAGSGFEIASADTEPGRDARDSYASAREQQNEVQFANKVEWLEKRRNTASQKPMVNSGNVSSTSKMSWASWNARLSRRSGKLRNSAIWSGTRLGSRKFVPCAGSVLLAPMILLPTTSSSNAPSSPIPLEDYDHGAIRER